mgnify:CR=1
EVTVDNIPNTVETQINNKKGIIGLSIGEDISLLTQKETPVVMEDGETKKVVKENTDEKMVKFKIYMDGV